MANTAPKPKNDVVQLQATNGKNGKNGNSAPRSKSLLQRALYHIAHDYLTLFAIGVLALLTLIVIIGPIITDNVLKIDPNLTNPSNNFQPIGATDHPLGTDELGRDMMARLLYAGRVSLAIGLLGSLFTLTIGLFLGVLTGYYGGVVDDLINVIIVTLDSIPTLYLLILVSAVFSPSAEALILVLALVGWTGTARLMRGQTLALRELDYVMAARASGASSRYIMIRHVLPNLISVTIVSLTIGVGSLILLESGLSFLGLGVQPPRATWGNMLAKAKDFFRLGHHLIILPGFLILTTVLCLYVVGDGVRDALDPHTH